MHDHTLLNKTIQVKAKNKTNTRKRKTKSKTKLDMTAKFGRITHNNGHFADWRSFKVTDFGTNRKVIYGFLYQDDS